MAAQFELFKERKGDRLNVRLAGDFDGSSACELINAIKEDSRVGLHVSVDTTGLKSVHPFGSRLLQTRRSEIAREVNSLVFSGKHKVCFER
jgi:hypothetical protein